MTAKTDPAIYEAWYHTARGAWIGRTESQLLLQLMQPVSGQTLLDVGCGTGYFSRRFANAGLDVTGIDPDPAMIGYACNQAGPITYLEGMAEQLPFTDNSFEYTTAVTSLCFISDPQQALAEMWRVSRQGVVLGLLNRHSILYRKKRNSGSYHGARWDTWSTAKVWIDQLRPKVSSHRHKTAILLPKAGKIARLVEVSINNTSPWGGFLAIYLLKH